MSVIQMYDPKREYNTHKNEIDAAIKTVLNHGLFINGPEVKDLENKLAEYVNVKHAISVSNGTDALKIALLALNIGAGDEVITVAYSWISTVEVIPLVGAKPVFVDIEADTFNIDPSKIEAKITDKTKAIIAVSIYGYMPDYDAINEIANKYNIPVIEDGAQSFGAIYKNKKSGSVTTIGTTSFFPSKPLGCYGDGGACFTNNDDLATKLRAIKNHGGIKRYHHKYIGLNARLDTIQAAILLKKLDYFEETIKQRNRCANYYTETLHPLVNSGFIFPSVKNRHTSVWAQYSILAKDKITRDKIVAYLKDNNINVAIFYPAPLHKQECFKSHTDSTYLPITDSICDRVFNLPCYGEFTKTEQDYIINLLIKYVTDS